jgi:hypothetical protein
MPGLDHPAAERTPIALDLKLCDPAVEVGLTGGRMVSGIPAQRLVAKTLSDLFIERPSQPPRRQAPQRGFPAPMRPQHHQDGCLRRHRATSSSRFFRRRPNGRAALNNGADLRFFKKPDFKKKPSAADIGSVSRFVLAGGRDEILFSA